MRSEALHSRRPLDASSDEQLAASAASGSLAAFTQILQRYERRVYNFVFRRLPCSADAEDVTQETFVRAWQRIDQYRPRHRFSTWLFTIAARLTINHLRSADRHRRHLGDFHAMRSHTAQEDDPAVLVAAREETGNIWSLAAACLSEEQLAALWLRYAEDLSIREIATVFGRTAVGVRVMLFRARTKLTEVAPRLWPQEDGAPAATHYRLGATVEHSMAGGM
jgi:RNA polymerase sigma-70 factor (ECF subfamily)